MRMIALLAAAALLAGTAGAQLPVGGGAIGGGGVGVDVGRTLNNTNATVRALDEGAHEPVAEANARIGRANDEARGRDAARVRAGARVSQGTRCYAADDVDRRDPYDPVRRDGYWYCEEPGVGVGAEARVGDPK